MKSNSIPTCVEHSQPKQWQLTTFEYDEDGITVRVPNIYAWVCPENGEASFTAETVDELILTVRDLLETAKRAKSRRASPNEFIVTLN
ncbi:MAG: YgiT-type zinc finger protein [Acidobacteria bacterium]|jgi:YgiT-type zinc finger domain-containing protein|nr:YgiT-type zinc finger protein [Acidobacteriota bacterium]MBA3784146.1 YgiT-type zinc finger protein [Acidobacteriota bacterium]MBA4121029.1 YgiT-type zinc finger protein [Acidobacteriota bacterium]MBA4182441.1 YgiT-type zinc finger protein [Acidobacteriota bacterium]HEV8160212.1 YgiT-type zinc finger protein [Pyrinomonadaceae bacterium]